jgi:hypothetical protein
VGVKVKVKVGVSVGVGGGAQIIGTAAIAHLLEVESVQDIVTEALPAL